ALCSPDTARRWGIGGAKRIFHQIEAEAEGLTSLEERCRFLTERPADLFGRLLPNLLPLMVPGMGSRFVAEARLQQWLGDTSGFAPILRALPHNPTTEMDLALWRLSRDLLAQGAEPSADHPGVQAFLAEYGHRAVREIDVGMPRWTDDPTHVLDVLRTYLSQTDDPEAHFRRGAEEAEQAAAALVERVRREKGWLRSRVLRFLLSRARALMGIREYPKFMAVRFIALMRKVLMAAGRDLVAAGRLDQPADVFMLDLTDLTAPGDLRARVAENRAAYARELERRLAPRVITSTGETFYTAPVAVEGGLPGTPASPGSYEGRVRVILDPKGAKLEPGEILVAPGTDPAWTPLFLSAGALVMEIGGIMSHGSVVAREYGIPAVVGVTDATHLLKTGQRVRVDGESGVVVPLD
ncbi:MAG TPA: PEP-utilizing enzyme, partial [Symbiobacteriaceae bacterium]|nr:PEP-utilizing enzyme [Symbiobacteriaceae bacterium]